MMELTLKGILKQVDEAQVVVAWVEAQDMPQHVLDGVENLKIQLDAVHTNLKEVIG